VKGSHEFTNFFTAEKRESRGCAEIFDTADCSPLILGFLFGGLRGLGVGGEVCPFMIK